MRYFMVAIVIILLLTSCGKSANSSSSNEINSAEDDTTVDSSVSKETSTEEQESSKAANNSSKEISANEDKTYQEEVVALRLTVPFRPLDNYSIKTCGSPIVKDETARQLSDFINRVTIFSMPRESFTSINDPSAQEFITVSSLYATRNVQWISPESDNYYPQLKPFLQISNYGEGYLKEHVEQTAKILFGDEIVISQVNALWNNITYNEWGGLYTVPGFGPYVVSVPVILSYEEFDDRYEIVVCFILSDWQSFVYYDEKYNTHPIPDNEIVDYCMKQERHNIVLKKQPDGSITYYSHILPSG